MLEKCSKAGTFVNHYTLMFQAQDTKLETFPQKETQTTTTTNTAETKQANNKTPCFACLVPLLQARSALAWEDHLQNVNKVSTSLEKLNIDNIKS